MTYQTIVQHAEKNYSTRDIDQLSPDALLVHSMWYSIQGEGVFAGFPAVFIRLAGCNRGAKLDCPWCDTHFLVSSAQKLTVPEIIHKVLEFPIQHGPDTLIVITGGEPLMHSKAPMLAAELIYRGYMVQFETNGDYVRADTVPGAFIVTSPKLSARTGKYSKPPAGMLQRSDYLKILVSANPDSPYHHLPDYMDEYVALHDTKHVFISPVNEYLRPVREGEIASMWSDLYDPVECGKNHRYAAEVALKYSYRLSLQTHAFVALP